MHTGERLGTGAVGNWVGDGRLVPTEQNVNPCAGEERLPLFVFLPFLF